MSIEILVPVIAALAGVGFGGLVAELRQFLQTSRENRKVLNRALYTHLDIWHTALRADPDTAIKEFPRVMAKVFGIAESDFAALVQQNPPLTEFIRDILATTFPTDLDARQREVVNRLADVHPILAYRVTGRPSVDSLLKAWRDKADAYVESLGDAEANKHMIAAYAPVIESQARAHQLATMERDILAIARAIGWLRYWQIKRLLKRAKTHSANEDEVVARMRSAFREAGLLPPAS